MTFAAGVAVHPGWTAAHDVRLWSKVDLDEPDSRQVMGFVKWESGLPAEKATVFMQNAYNFRKYVRRVETDEQGYFRFFDVPGNESYLVFAVPPRDDSAMRENEYFGVGFFQREVWRELTLHQHRVTGLYEAASPELALQLVRIDEREERVIWSFRADRSGRFTVANVPHGRYRVQPSPGDRGKAARSLPLEVTDGRSEVVVRWPKAVAVGFEIFNP